jgi:hypothetical protein
MSEVWLPASGAEVGPVPHACGSQGAVLEVPGGLPS